jgi:hypothetical protein
VDPEALRREREEAERRAVEAKKLKNKRKKVADAALARVPTHAVLICIQSTSILAYVMPFLVLGQEGREGLGARGGEGGDCAERGTQPEADRNRQV